jgi:hypothetical protein
MQDRTNRARLRASKACSRCNQRKVKCDAAQIGVPCSRCQMDHVNDCTLIVSKRGIYDRKNAQNRHQSFDHPSAVGRSTPPTDPQDMPQANFGTITSTRDTPIRARNRLRGDPQPENFAGFSSHVSPNSIQANDSTPSESPGAEEASIRAPRILTNSKASSLTEMFEEFLKQQNESTLEKHGIVLPGEPSPLTFALEEFQRGKNQRLYDVHDHIGESASMTVIMQDVHPPHLDINDITYLKAKGAFEYPKNDTADTFLSSYLERFHPLYSIVKKSEFQTAYRERKLPWLLLHAVHFIGATFCDSSSIHQLGFKSRAEVRSLYYERAKVLFTVGYEKDKITLLQAAIMLSFIGPQLKHYWNPCSWIGFGVTIAVSLGMHRSAVSANAHSNDKGLLRRLWWTLSVRDAYLCTLLGRSFRLNMSLCDTEPLSCADFDDDTACSHQDSDCSCKHSIYYQIQTAKLSLLLRNVVYYRIGPVRGLTTLDDLQSQLKNWQSELQPAVNWSQHNGPLPTFAVILKILYNYHLILLHMAEPKEPVYSTSQTALDKIQSSLVAESAASAIASTAVTIMTKSVIFALPHELFPAFFLAGIILYRQTRQPDPAVAEVGQASLDNCQIVLNEARESWDPWNWAMRIFEFLLSSSSISTGDTQNRVSRQGIDVNDELPTVSCTAATETVHLPLTDQLNTFIPSLDWNAAFDANGTDHLEDFMLLPNCWLSAAEDWQNVHL